MLSEFLAEEREAEIQRSKTSQAETHKQVCDTLQLEWGRGEDVPPQEAKELILQVTFSLAFVFFKIFSELFQSS